MGLRGDLDGTWRVLGWYLEGTWMHGPASSAGSTEGKGVKLPKESCRTLDAMGSMHLCSARRRPCRARCGGSLRAFRRAGLKGPSTNQPFRRFRRWAPISIQNALGGLGAQIWATIIPGGPKVPQMSPFWLLLG